MRVSEETWEKEAEAFARLRERWERKRAQMMETSFPVEKRSGDELESRKERSDE